MKGPHIDVEAVLADLKDFQRRTARWTFQRMFVEQDPAIRFLVADEVGLGKTHVAKGVVAQVIDHLRRTDDARHDIVYVCSNAAIARQNVRKLVPAGIEPLAADRLTMLPLANLNGRDEQQAGVNLLPITPGTSLNFGRSTGTFTERCLAYAFLRASWGASVMNAPARRIFWSGVWAGDPDGRLRWEERQFRPRIRGVLGEFEELLNKVEISRRTDGRTTLRELFDELAAELAWKRKRKFPDGLHEARGELLGEVRHIMARVGIAKLQPDLVILDEFQRYKDLLQRDPGNSAVELAQQLLSYTDPHTGRATRTLLLSATPYRMYSTGDAVGEDHYEDFFDTCSFLFEDPASVDRLRDQFGALRLALTSTESLAGAEEICRDIGTELSRVMARTERLAATPNRDGMLHESDTLVEVKPLDLRAYRRLGDLAEVAKHYEPTEYWKSAPYLVNFMETYKLKEAVVKSAADGFPDGGGLGPGPGLLNWRDVEAYRRVDPQNGRLRWLLGDLERHRAFELLWVPPSMRYYDAGSVYETPDAASFTKRLIFSGWAVVPKVVSSLVSYEAERHAFAGRGLRYTAGYRRRGGQRLTFRRDRRTTGQARRGESTGARRAAGMTTFLLVWPSPSLAELGDPRPLALSRGRPASEVLAAVESRISDAITPLVRGAPTGGAIDERWYWAAPLLLDQQDHPSAMDRLLARSDLAHWEGGETESGLSAHVAEARALLDYGVEALGRPPDGLSNVLAQLAIGGPAQCALRAIGSVAELPIAGEAAVLSAARVGAAFRRFFNAPEVTGIIDAGRTVEPDAEEGGGRYWQDVLRHAIDGNLQAVLDEHTHVVRDWLGHVRLVDDDRRAQAANDIAQCIVDALELRTSWFRVDIPRRGQGGRYMNLAPRRMRTRFAVPFGNQTLDGGGEARVESVSRAFNSPFWPFVLTSTSIGQEGLDFHLWCHAVVHWNIPTNPVDLEQREGRVHRYKGHAVRRNIAATLAPDLFAGALDADADPWRQLFAMALPARPEADGEMVPYWVFHRGPAKIERLVPVLPFSQDAATLPRLRKSLAAYRLAFGQPRQEELVQFLKTDRSDDDLLQLASRLRIELSPPRPGQMPD